MRAPSFRWRFVAVPAAAVALAGATAVALGAGSGSGAVRYPAAGGQLTGVRPIAVGLPQIGESGTVGASELPSSLKTYHDSGAYDRDLATVDGAAKAYLDARIAHPKSPSDCTIVYKRAHRSRLYKRVRKCVAHTGKLAIVLDIDETSLSNYTGLLASGFSSAGTVGPALGGTGTAIAPTLALYQDARAHNVAVFFITGRPSAIASISENNLRSVGYDKGWNGAFYKPGGDGTEAFKSSTRAMIERQGYDIVTNVGDQESDLDGAHADRAFKLPNPFYFIPD
jgi:hypothetical protein